MPPDDYPEIQRRSVVIYGEHDGHAYVTVKTEVTIEVRNPDDVEEALNAALRSEAGTPPAWQQLGSGVFPPAGSRDRVA